MKPRKLFLPDIHKVVADLGALYFRMARLVQEYGRNPGAYETLRQIASACSDVRHRAYLVEQTALLFLLRESNAMEGSHSMRSVSDALSLALFYADTQNYLGAIRVLTPLVDADGPLRKNSFALGTLAESLMAEKRYVDALPVARSWCELAQVTGQDVFLSHILLGFCLLHLGQLEEASRAADGCSRVATKGKKSATLLALLRRNVNRARAKGNVGR